VQAGAFQLTVDEPPEVGGGGRGPMPTDLLLASVASCYALALAWAARKHGVDLPDLTVTATGTYAGPRFRSLALTVRTGLAAHLVTPLLEPARRVCYVTNTLADVPISPSGWPTDHRRLMARLGRLLADEQRHDRGAQRGRAASTSSRKRARSVVGSQAISKAFRARAATSATLNGVSWCTRWKHSAT
jgi:putative redox protein